MHDDLYQFLACDYFATGEGRTLMLLITRAYPTQTDYETQGKFEDAEYIPPKIKDGHTPKVIAAREFADEFGSWYAQGAENLSCEEFLKRFGKHLPPYIEQILNLPLGERPGNFNLKLQIHLNFS